MAERAMVAPAPASSGPKPPGRSSALELPDEVVDLIGHAALGISPGDVLRLCQACQSLRTKLGALRALAQARRLRWLPGFTMKHETSEDGRTLSVVRGSDDIEPWVAGGLLPTAGKSAWKIQVVQSMRDDGNGMWIGVCDAPARLSWGLSLYSGRLRRICRDADGRIDFGALPPEGFPNGNYKKVMRSSLRSQATGAVIEVLVDHDDGTLGFRVNGGPCLEALPLGEGDRCSGGQPRVFPPGLPLRPYASCYYAGDRMRFVTICV